MRNFLNFLAIFSLPSLVLIMVFLLTVLLFFVLGTAFLIALPVIFILFLILLFTKKKRIKKESPNDVVIDVEVL